MTAPSGARSSATRRAVCPRARADIAGKRSAREDVLDRRTSEEALRVRLQLRVALEQADLQAEDQRVADHDVRRGERIADDELAVAESVRFFQRAARVRAATGGYASQTQYVVDPPRRTRAPSDFCCAGTHLFAHRAST